jgi:hypothetical protein
MTTMSHTITVPFAPGTHVWVPRLSQETNIIPCPDCDRTKKVVVETKAGRFELACETCTVGFDGPYGVLERRGTKHIPYGFACGNPRIDGSGRVTYMEGEATSGYVYDADEMFATQEACEARCFVLEARRIEYQQQELLRTVAKGREKVVSQLRFCRDQIRQAKDTIARHEEAARVLGARPSGETA